MKPVLPGCSAGCLRKLLTVTLYKYKALKQPYLRCRFINDVLLRTHKTANSKNITQPIRD